LKEGGGLTGFKNTFFLEGNEGQEGQEGIKIKKEPGLNGLPGLFGLFIILVGVPITWFTTRKAFFKCNTIHSVASVRTVA
jgi:hypothetical protein